MQREPEAPGVRAYGGSAPPPPISRARSPKVTHTFPLFNPVNALRCWVTTEGRLALKTALRPYRALGPGSRSTASSVTVPVGPQTSPPPPPSCLPTGDHGCCSQAGWSPGPGMRWPGRGSRLVLTTGSGRLGVTVGAVGRGGRPEWRVCTAGAGSGERLVGAGATPFAGLKPPSWNRGLESPMAVLGATFLPRKRDESVPPGLGVLSRDVGVP